MTEIEKDSSKTQGRWTKLEHEKFLLGIIIFLIQDCKCIPKIGKKSKNSLEPETELKSDLMLKNSS
jgi:hypothetical protein